MAKSIRSIKNTLCADETLGQCSIAARYLFVGLITQVDDHGRFRSHPALVRGQVFPYDDLTTADVEALLQELEQRGRIQLYTVDGQRYGHIVHWADHQRVDNAARSELPPPPQPAETSGDTPPPDPHDTSEPRRPAAACGESRRFAAACGEPPLERKGRDRKGKERCANSDADNTAPAAGQPPPDGGPSQDPTILETFDQFWAAYPRRNGRLVGKDACYQRWRKLKPGDRADILTAVRNYAAERGDDKPIAAKDPERWLRDRRWVDYLAPPPTNVHQLRRPARRTAAEIMGLAAHPAGAQP